MAAVVMHADGLALVVGDFHVATGELTLQVAALGRRAAGFLRANKVAHLAAATVTPVAPVTRAAPAVLDVVAIVILAHARAAFEATWVDQAAVCIEAVMRDVVAARLWGRALDHRARRGSALSLSLAHFIAVIPVRLGLWAFATRHARQRARGVLVVAGLGARRGARLENTTTVAAITGELDCLAARGTFFVRKVVGRALGARECAQNVVEMARCTLLAGPLMPVRPALAERTGSRAVGALLDDIFELGRRVSVDTSVCVGTDSLRSGRAASA